MIILPYLSLSLSDAAVIAAPVQERGEDQNNRQHLHGRHGTRARARRLARRDRAIGGEQRHHHDQLCLRYDKVP